MRNKAKKKKNYKYKVASVCPLQGLEDQINYKNIQLLKKFISTRGRILPRSRTGVALKRHRMLINEIKKARYISLLPYTKYV